MAQPNPAGMFQGTSQIGASPSSIAGNALQAGSALAQRAGGARQLGNWQGMHTARINAGPANTGQRWNQVPGQANRGAAITARPITVTEGESGGEHDASNFVYTVVPYNMNAMEGGDVNKQTHLEPGDPVFVQTVVVEQYVLYNMLNAGQLNSALRDNTVLFQTRVAKSDPTAVKFMAYLRRWGEHWLNVYALCRARNTIATELAPLFGDNSAQAMDELKDFFKMSTDRDYYSLTRYGITSMWNFVGFVLTTSDPLRLKGIQQFGYSRVLSVNVTVKGNFEAALQLWRGIDIPAQAKLYFVLTRVPTERGAGPFQFVPWGSRTRESVPRSILAYRDESGALADGHTVFVGTVHLAPNREASDSMRLVAAGLIPETPHMQREAGAQLTRHNGQLRVQVGIF